MRHRPEGSNDTDWYGSQFPERTQRIYARVAGFLFLWLIVTGLAGPLTISHIVGSGTFAETAKRVVASEHLYRVALSSELIETLSASLLAFALYVTLKPVDKLLAQFAMYRRLGESFVGSVGTIIGFTRLSLYTSPQIGPYAIWQGMRVSPCTTSAQYSSVSARSLPVFQIEIYSQDPGGLRCVCLSHRVNYLFRQSDRARTRSDAPRTPARDDQQPARATVVRG